LEGEWKDRKKRGPRRIRQHSAGAINTGLAYLISKNFTPEDCFVAILDDDDFWEVLFLEERDWRYIVFPFEIKVLRL